LITVALVGADGAGKTTVAQLAVAVSTVPASYLYMGLNPESTRFALPTSRLALYIKKRLLKRRFIATGSADQDFADWGHVTLSEHPVVQILRLVNRIFDSSVRTTIAFIMSAKGSVIVTDRHFVVDHGLDRLLGHRSSTFGARAFGWVVTHLFPPPDLVIHLDAPAATLFERKAEGGLEYLEKTQAHYRRAAEVFPRFETVDATKELEDVVNDVVALIDDFVIGRATATGSVPRR
jgi:thymidylate kinase